jgi:formamidopyrimidine-DNA glycosylase
MGGAARCNRDPTLNGSDNAPQNPVPELPEVETTRRGIEAALVGRTVTRAVLHEVRLRWPVARELADVLRGQRVHAVKRRAKYLLIELGNGTLIVHLGMSGSLRLMPANTPRLTHDHVELVLDDDAVLRFNDPRRFGSLHFVTDDPLQHPLLARLAPEPLEDEFDGQYLWRITRKRQVAIKQLLMNGQLVVGVGNIYASEALFRAGVRPTRTARRLTRIEAEKLAAAIKTVLRDAITAGGTTLRDYVNADGMPGYFRQKLYVYERTGEPCRVCGNSIRHLVQGQRASFYCPACQK